MNAKQITNTSNQFVLILLLVLQKAAEPSKLRLLNQSLLFNLKFILKNRLYNGNVAQIRRIKFVLW